MFSKKSISGNKNYTIDIIVDFVYGKTKLLYSKYHQVSDELKVLQEEQEHYFKDRVNKLNDQNEDLKECKYILRKVVLPKLYAMLRGKVYLGQNAGLQEEVKRLLDEFEKRYKKYEEDSILAE